MGAVVFPTFFLDNHGMALIVFLRGVNVGGHRAFRPSILARELSDYDVVNVGAAGTVFGCPTGSLGRVPSAVVPEAPFSRGHVLFGGPGLFPPGAGRSLSAWASFPD